ncbi:MAG: hypothetical protein QM737_02410 [Ferruginibacter sp.]
MKKEKQNISNMLPDDSRLTAPTNQNSFSDQHIISPGRTNPQLYLQAQQFALAILADPILKELYTSMAGNRCTAYSLALSEYLALREQGQWIF